MATDIFCVTYADDARWLEYMLRSIDKFARGFRRTVVVYPRTDQVQLDPVCSAHPNVTQVLFDQGADGHMDQNALKTSADLHSDAEFFLHMDSDCVFTQPASPHDYATGGKPDIWYEYYQNLGPDKVPGGVPWQGVTEMALHIPVTVETMRRFPFLYPRWLYQKTRERIEKIHRVPFLQYVRTAPCIKGAFHGYAEFNALGCMAFYEFPREFTLRHMADAGAKPAKVAQFWSHWLRRDPAKFENEIVPELEQITAGYNEVQHAA
jgi:hypothetical protein